LNADDEAAKQANVKVLNEISPFIRHELAKRMRLRHNLRATIVHYDHSFDYRHARFGTAARTGRPVRNQKVEQRREQLLKTATGR